MCKKYIFQYMYVSPASRWGANLNWLLVLFLFNWTDGSSYNLHRFGRPQPRREIRWQVLHGADTRYRTRKKVTINSLLVTGLRKKLRLFIYPLMGQEKSYDFFATRLLCYPFLGHEKNKDYFPYSLLGQEKSNHFSVHVTGSGTK